MLKNYYEEYEDYAIIITQKCERIIIDKDKLKELRKYRWFIDKKGYASCYYKVDGKQKNLKMHRLVIDAPSKAIVDHKDKNKLNNRLSNLRIVNSTESNRNNTRRKDNTSGVTGVMWDNTKKRWRAFVYVNSKRISLLYTKDKVAAIKARLLAEIEYYGIDFAPQKDLFEKYNII